MRDALVFGQLESEIVVAILEIVDCGGKVRAAATVSGRRAPVESQGALRVHVGHFCAQSGQRLGRVDLFDRRERTLARLLRPLGELDAAAQHQVASPREDGQQCRPIGLLKEVVRAIVLRRIRANAVEADLCRFAPAADHREMPAPVEHAWRNELDLGALVVGNRVAATHVEVVIGAHVIRVADAQRKAAA